MLKKKFQLNSKDKIEVAWEPGFSKSIVLFNGNEIGRFDSKMELFAGKEFQLYADETIFIGFSRKHSQFIIKQNGVYSEFSPYHPRHELYWLTLVVCMYAIICLVADGIYFYHAMTTFDFLSEFGKIYFTTVFTYDFGLLISMFLIRKGIGFAFPLMLVLIGGWTGFASYIFSESGAWMEAGGVVGFTVLTLIRVLIFVMLMKHRPHISEVKKNYEKSKNFNEFIQS